MEPHEWANQIGRTADSDIRSLDAIVDKYRELKEVAQQLRNLSRLDNDTNREVDDISVGLSGISRELDSISSKLSDYAFDLRSAIAAAWNS